MLKTPAYLAAVAGLCVAGLVGTGCGGDEGGATTIIERTVVQTTPPPDTTATEPQNTNTSAEPQPPPPEEGRGDPLPPDPSEAPGEILELSAFTSPTGNIGCMLVGGTARCDIQNRNWEAPRPDGCPPDSDYGQGLELGDSGPGRVVCAGDTARDPNAPVLEYGTGASSDDLVCVSRSSGMTCTNAATGHGFMINRERYELF